MISRRDQYRFKLPFQLQRSSEIKAKPSRIPILYGKDDAVIYLIVQTQDIFGREAGRKAEWTDMVTYCLEGGPFPSETAAMNSGTRSKAALLVWALKRGVGIDFPFGPPVTDRWDAFTLDFLVTVVPKKAQTPGRFAKAFDKALQNELSDKLLLAIELFTAAEFDSSLRSQFVSRVTAIEAIMEQPSSSKNVLDLLEELLRTVRNCGLEQVDKDQLLNGLGMVKKKSKTQTGINLATNLLKRHKYNGMSPGKFFKDCYEIRSKIVHNGSHGIGEKEFSDLAVGCENLVRDLLLAALRVENARRFEH